MKHIIDDLYLTRFDERNLVIVKGKEPKDKKRGYGKRIQGFYGSVQSAYRAVLNLHVIGGASGVEAKEILDAIDLLHKRIDSLDIPAVHSLLRG